MFVILNSMTVKNNLKFKSNFNLPKNFNCIEKMFCDFVSDLSNLKSMFFNYFHFDGGSKTSRIIRFNKLHNSNDFLFLIFFFPTLHQTKLHSRTLASSVLNIFGLNVIYSTIPAYLSALRRSTT